MITIDTVKDCLEEAVDVAYTYFDDFKHVDFSNIRLTKSIKYLARITKIAFKSGVAYRLDVSETIFNNFNNIEDMKYRLTSTLIYELVHTCPNCYNHGKEFKNHCRIINNKTKYNIWTTTNLNNCEGFNWVEYKKLKEAKIKSKIRYQVTCPCCGKHLGTYVRKSKCIQFPQFFRCGYCKHDGLKIVEEKIK